MNIIDYFVYLIFRFFHCPPVGKNANDAKLFSLMIAGWIMGMFIMTIGYSYLLCTIKWITIISIIMVVVTLFILNRYVDMLHS